MLCQQWKKVIKLDKIADLHDLVVVFWEVRLENSRGTGMV